jgi:micrococcal nuclease
MIATSQPAPNDGRHFTYFGTLNRVIDGDTIDVLLDLGLKVYKGERLRLARINAPDAPVADKDKASAFLQHLLDNAPHELKIETLRLDPYGRWVSEIWLAGGLNLSDAMLAAGMAVPYPTPKVPA